MNEAAQRLARVIEEWTGLDLGRGGRFVSLERLVRTRMSACGVDTLDDYLRLVQRHDDPEALHLINAITVGHTWFYRDPEQLGIIRDILATQYETGRALDIWVPGCATGEDVYSIAMIARLCGRPVRILGTDINSRFLSTAEKGVYREWSVKHLPDRYRQMMQPEKQGFYSVPDEIKQAARFRRHNLVAHPPLPEGRDGWDLVLCRNVLIYFRASQARGTLQRFGTALSADGWLLLGAGEVITRLPDGLETVVRGGRVTVRHYQSSRAPASVSEERVPQAVPAVSRPQVSAPATPPPINPFEPDPVDITREIVLEDVLAKRVRECIDEGNTALRAGDLEAAFDAYSRALEEDPLDEEARLLAGIAYHMARDAQAAMHALRGVLFLNPGLWVASYYLALSYENLGRPMDAEREYRRAVEGQDQPLPFPDGSFIVEDVLGWKQDLIAHAKTRLGQLAPRRS